MSRWGKGHGAPPGGMQLTTRFPAIKPTTMAILPHPTMQSLDTTSVLNGSPRLKDTGTE
jgi:hypothetical protein